MNGNADRQASRQAGFSVVEAVVALTLLSIVLALMSTALNASRHALRRVLAQDAQLSFATSMRFVEQRLADAQPLYEKRIGNQASIHFVGEPDRVEFLTAVEGGEVAGGIYHVELGTSRAGPARLTLRLTPYAPNRSPVAPPSEERVIDPTVSRVGIGYFGPDARSGIAVWHESWIGRKELPFIIRISAWRNGKSAGAIHVPLLSGRALMQVKF